MGGEEATDGRRRRRRRRPSLVGTVLATSLADLVPEMWGSDLILSPGGKKELPPTENIY